MICPECGHNGCKVFDSRATNGGDAVRRRRECEDCSARFTTVEIIYNDAVSINGCNVIEKLTQVI